MKTLFKKSSVLALPLLIACGLDQNPNQYLNQHYGNQQFGNQTAFFPNQPLMVSPNTQPFQMNQMGPTYPMQSSTVIYDLMMQESEEYVSYYRIAPPEAFTPFQRSQRIHILKDGRYVIPVARIRKDANREPQPLPSATPTPTPIDNEIPVKDQPNSSSSDASTVVTPSEVSPTVDSESPTQQSIQPESSKLNFDQINDLQTQLKQVERDIENVKNTNLDTGAYSIGFLMEMIRALPDKSEWSKKKVSDYLVATDVLKKFQQNHLMVARCEKVATDPFIRQMDQHGSALMLKKNELSLDQSKKGKKALQAFSKTSISDYFKTQEVDAKDVLYYRTALLELPVEITDCVEAMKNDPSIIEKEVSRLEALKLQIQAQLQKLGVVGLQGV